MCNLGVAVGMKGYEQGAEETRIQDFENLMENLKLTAQQAMDALDIPEKEQTTTQMFEQFYGKSFSEITSSDIGSADEFAWGEDIGGEAF